MITEKLSDIFGWRLGYLLHEGFQVKCAGTLDADGNSNDKHLICMLDDHLPNTQAHAIGNPEFTDDLWVIEPGQETIDWSSPMCQICKQPLAP